MVRARISRQEDCYGRSVRHAHAYCSAQHLAFAFRGQGDHLDNKKDVVVRINDRGPFVDDRVIDLSLASAKELGVVGPGTAPVRLTVLTGGGPMIALKKSGAATENKPIARAPNPFFTGGISKLFALTRN